MIVNILAVVACHATADDVPYTVPDKPWPEQHGLHRAVVEVAAPADAVRVRLPWRRRDEPAGKQILILDRQGKAVRNVFRVSVDRWKADLVIGPAIAAGTYHVYYLPFPVQPGWGGYGGSYLPPEPAPDAAWVKKHGLGFGVDPAGLPEAKLLAFQSRTAFDSFWPMEIPATPGETEAVIAKRDSPFLVFPEDRRFPIRMPEAIPTRWLKGPDDTFRGEALRNEYFSFQVGVFAARQALEGLTVTFTDLRNGDAVLPTGALTCFNTGGIDCYGKPFAKTVSVPQGQIQPLWIGVDIPRDAVPGAYAGTMMVGAKNASASPVKIVLSVRDAVIEDRGDAELWRHSRLRWLNSTAGTADTPVPPYTAVEVLRDERPASAKAAAGKRGTRGREETGPAVTCLGRKLTLAPNGLPEQVQSWGREVLAAPVRFAVETGDGGIVSFTPSKTAFVHVSVGSAVWETVSKSPTCSLTLRGKMEFDGHVHYWATVTSDQQDLQVRDIRLQMPFRPDVGEYMMGMGRPGGFVPERHDWKWQGPQDSFWMGNAFAGLHCELRGSTYHGPLLNRVRPPHPPVWKNGGRGGFRVRRTGDHVTATAYSGPRTLKAGQPVTFEFAFIITPVKPLDTATHFRNRYFHHIDPRDEHVKAGVRIINVHHGNDMNPYINYPFTPEGTAKLQSFVDTWHRRGLKVKIYYTLRELTNHIHEIWALRSLGTEVLAGGGGGGYPWLREHFRTNYWPRWYQHFADGRVCAAVANSGESRWYNYYVESLGWLLKNVDIDGLYLDDVSYDRRILKRMRRVMAGVKKECIIDLHSNTGFSIGPATQYTEFFPYVDKIWFGESFQYNRMSPDQWLVECSGIPFGLMGDMLQGGGNRWLGMVYGMTARMPWAGASDPRPVWAVWDAFGITNAKMIGYWDQVCPVRTDREDVKATAYVRKGKALIALGSWAKQRAKVRLTFDWKALGLDPAKASLYAPPVESFQPEAVWKPSDAIPVPPLKGWLLYVDETPQAARKLQDPMAGRRLLFEATFKSNALSKPWKPRVSKRPGTKLSVTDGVVRIAATAHSCAFIERALPDGVTAVEARIHTGTDRGESWGPGLLLAWSDRTVRINIRATERRYGIDTGVEQWLFGGSPAQNASCRLRILLDKDEVRLQAMRDDWIWETVRTFPRADYPGNPTVLRVGKMDGGGKGQDYVAPGGPGECGVEAVRVYGGER